MAGGTGDVLFSCCYAHWHRYVCSYCASLFVSFFLDEDSNSGRGDRSSALPGYHVEGATEHVLCSLATGLQARGPKLDPQDVESGAALVRCRFKVTY